MNFTRLIPTLLWSQRGLWKTRSFSSPRYLGDPLNIVRIFSGLSVDELILLNIDRALGEQHFAEFRDIAEECNVPLCYGGGITRLDQIGRMFRLGVEKVALNSALAYAPDLLRQAVSTYGSQAIVASLDLRLVAGSYRVYVDRGQVPLATTLAQTLEDLQAAGAGELLVTVIDREGGRGGFDLELFRSIRSQVSIPIIAHGGAGSLSDLAEVLRTGVNAAAAGSLFSFQGAREAVLINYPDRTEREALQIDSRSIWSG